MKKIIAGVILSIFCSMILIAPIVEAKTNATKKKTVSAYVKTKHGYKHTTYKRKQHYKK